MFDMARCWIFAPDLLVIVVNVGGEIVLGFPLPNRLINVDDAFG
jgi:hypothetical protein